LFGFWPDTPATASVSPPRARAQTTIRRDNVLITNTLL
jgi:hypothetical protein